MSLSDAYLVSNELRETSYSIRGRSRTQHEPVEFGESATPQAAWTDQNGALQEGVFQIRNLIRAEPLTTPACEKEYASQLLVEITAAMDTFFRDTLFDWTNSYSAILDRIVRPRSEDLAPRIWHIVESKYREAAAEMNRSLRTVPRLRKRQYAHLFLRYWDLWQKKSCLSPQLFHWLDGSYLRPETKTTFQEHLGEIFREHVVWNTDFCKRVAEYIQTMILYAWKEPAGIDTLVSEAGVWQALDDSLTPPRHSSRPNHRSAADDTPGEPLEIVVKLTADLLGDPVTEMAAEIVRAGDLLAWIPLLDKCFGGILKLRDTVAGSRASSLWDSLPRQVLETVVRAFIPRMAAMSNFANQEMSRDFNSSVTALAQKWKQRYGDLWPDACKEIGEALTSARMEAAEEVLKLAAGAPESSVDAVFWQFYADLLLHSISADLNETAVTWLVGGGSEREQVKPSGPALKDVGTVQSVAVAYALKEQRMERSDRSSSIAPLIWYLIDTFAWDNFIREKRRGESLELVRPGLGEVECPYSLSQVRARMLGDADHFKDWMSVNAMRSDFWAAGFVEPGVIDGPNAKVRGSIMNSFFWRGISTSLVSSLPETITKTVETLTQEPLLDIRNNYLADHPKFTLSWSLELTACKFIFQAQNSLASVWCSVAQFLVLHTLALHPCALTIGQLSSLVSLPDAALSHALVDLIANDAVIWGRDPDGPLSFMDTDVISLHLGEHLNGKRIFAVHYSDSGGPESTH